MIAVYMWNFYAIRLPTVKGPVFSTLLVEIECYVFISVQSPETEKKHCFCLA